MPRPETTPTILLATLSSVEAAANNAHSGMFVLNHPDCEAARAALAAALDHGTRYGGISAAEYKTILDGTLAAQRLAYAEAYWGGLWATNLGRIMEAARLAIHALTR